MFRVRREAMTGTRNTKINILGLLIFLLFTAVVSHAEGWRGLTPLKSTRADVERVFGPPGEYKQYHFEDEKVSINYYDGACNKIKDCRCLVPKDTILSIFVVVEVEMRFSKLGLDKTKYEKVISRNDPTVAVYSNYDAGISYTVDEEHDDVMSIEYFPAAKDCRNIIKRTGRRSRTHLQEQVRTTLFFN
jgi:hypothetical protein